jgi:hypothetical protein
MDCGLVQTPHLRHQVLDVPLERRDRGALRGDGLAQAAQFALDLLARHAQDLGPECVGESCHRFTQSVEGVELSGSDKKPPGAEAHGRLVDSLPSAPRGAGQMGADLLGRYSKELEAVGGWADELRARGLACRQPMR